MRFNPTAFDRHLANIGQRVRWWKSYGCACVSPTSGAADARCRACSGKGVFWPESAETVCGLAGQDAQAKWAQVGVSAAGDLVVTIPASSPMWDAGQFDRVRMQNGTERFSLPLTRGSPAERLPFAAERLDRAIAVDRATGVVTQLVLPQVSEAGEISWPDGDGPLPGSQYALSGYRYPDYYIFQDIPSNRNMHSGMRLPRKVVLRSFDMFRR